MIRLRPECAEDAVFLYCLFCSARTAEFAHLPESQREPLLRMQYQAQACAYEERFPHSEHYIVELQGQPAGRLLLNRATDELRVVDITVLPELRGRGIASAVLQSLMVEAESAALPLTLSVWHDNPALSLYRRLGFVVRSESATYLELEWRPAAD